MTNYDMSECETNPYEGGPKECRECNRAFTPSAHAQDMCPFCEGETTCNNEGCDAQARVHDTEAGGLSDNYCEPCWADICQSADE